MLKDLSLVVKDGECFTLLGPSGCGKTVLLRLLAGFDVPDSGRILIDEHVVSDPAEGIDIPLINEVWGWYFKIMRFGRT